MKTFVFHGKPLTRDEIKSVEYRHSLVLVTLKKDNMVLVESYKTNTSAARTAALLWEFLDDKDDVSQVQSNSDGS